MSLPGANVQQTLWYLIRWWDHRPIPRRASQKAVNKQFGKNSGKKKVARYTLLSVSASEARLITRGSNPAHGDAKRKRRSYPKRRGFRIGGPELFSKLQSEAS